ncbi:MAG: TerB family tellurite resistance protein [Xanthobacteraceae bacterium]|jgi:uncharacterized tellurite resistance protein B-like protein|uniref:tellurite resistance TerB family protein n=1 Tax=Pseudolabrys sp. TaxID=1960880 RepID=UPI003D0C2149
MFEALKNILSDLGGGGDEPRRFDENDFRLMATALLVHAAAIDGRVSDVEFARLRTVVKDTFRLDDAQVEELVESAVKAEQEAIDLYRFTSTLNRLLDEPGRTKVIEMMWQIIVADGAVSEFEDNLVWRAADLLGISREKRIALRQQAQDREGREDG